MPHKANSTFKENIKWVVKFPNVLLQHQENCLN